MSFPRDLEDDAMGSREDPEASGALLGVLRKLSLLSGTLGEIDDWLESRGPAAAGGSGRRGPITLENLEEHVAREGG
jgi:hypothetical protein